MTDINLTLELQDFAYFLSIYSPLLIFINCVVTFTYTMCTLLALKRTLPPFIANLFRLFSVIVSTLLLTLLFTKYSIDALNQKDSLIAVLVYLSFMHWLYLWFKNFDIRYVLSTQVITTIFFLVLWVFKFDLIIKGASAFLWLLSIYSLALGFTHLLSFDNFSVFRLLNKRLEHYPWYKNSMEHAKVDKAMVLYVPCGLTINMVNLIYLIQVGDGWFVYLLIGICLWSIGYQTLLAIGLCTLCETRPVKYHWNFIIQSYLNLSVIFKIVWQQTRNNNLPREIPLVNLGMAFLLAAIQLPIVGYCAGPESLTNVGTSGELSSEEGSRDLFGNKNKPAPGNKAVGEGQTASKLGKAAKPVASFAAKEAQDFGKKTYEKIKDTGSTATAAGVIGGMAYTASEGAKAAGVELPSLPGTSANTELESRLEALESKKKGLESEIKELKAAKEQSSGQEQTTKTEEKPLSTKKSIED